jgi:hypothetical protein
MKKILHLTCVLIAVYAFLPPNLALATPNEAGMRISEIQTGSTLGGIVNTNDEFIELYNNSDQTININGWKLEYHPATRVNNDFGSPSQSVTLNGLVGARKHYLLGRATYYIGQANQSFSEPLADSGGHLRLVSGDVSAGSLTQHDLVGWGTAKSPEGVAAAPAPGNLKTLTRKSVDSVSLQDTDINSDDFIKADGTPVSDAIIPPVEDPPQTPPPDDPVVDPPTDPVVENPPPEEPIPPPEIPPPPAAPALPLQITELLPNPAAPATDDNDEFVELFNPNDQAIDLAGYVLKTGANLTYQQNLNGLSIGPKTYLVLYSKDTDLVLSNTTGRAVLFDPSGASIATSDAYSDAPEGQSWQITNNVWQWSTVSSPAAQNVVSPPIFGVPNAAKSALKKTTAKKASTPKVASAKTATAKKASTAKPKAAKSTNPSSQAAALVEGQPLHPAVLGFMGSLALLYGVYEYRGDIRNQIRKFRRN